MNKAKPTPGLFYYRGATVFRGADPATIANWPHGYLPMAKFPFATMADGVSPRDASYLCDLMNKGCHYDALVQALSNILDATARTTNSEVCQMGDFSEARAALAKARGE